MVDFLKMFYVYKVGESAGRKPWEDPTLLTAVITFLSTIVAKYWGWDIKPDEQAAIITIFTLLARLFSPHVGIRPQTVAEVNKGVPSETVLDPQAGSAATSAAKDKQVDAMTNVEKEKHIDDMLDSSGAQPLIITPAQDANSNDPLSMGRRDAGN